MSKLSKVCSKAFILIDADTESIPFTLARKLQKLGKQIKWVPVEDVQDELMLTQMGFVIGKLHHKVSIDIEFAILSNDSRFDQLISLINADNRICQRVRTTPIDEPFSLDEEEESFDQVEFSESYKSLDEGGSEVLEMSPSFAYHEPRNGNELKEVKTDTRTIEIAAKATVQRLVNSGNRPSELDILRDYILLHNEALTSQDNVDDVITQMEKSESIRLSAHGVIYNF